MDNIPLEVSKTGWIMWVDFAGGGYIVGVYVTKAIFSTWY